MSGLKPRPHNPISYCFDVNQSEEVRKEFIEILAEDHPDWMIEALQHQGHIIEDGQRLYCSIPQEKGDV